MDTLRTFVTPTGQNAQEPKSVAGSTKKKTGGLKLNKKKRKKKKKKKRKKKKPDGANTNSGSALDAKSVWMTAPISDAATSTALTTASSCAGTATKKKIQINRFAPTAFTQSTKAMSSSAHCTQFQDNVWSPSAEGARDPAATTTTHR